MFTRLISSLRAVLNPSSTRAELDEEMAFHLDALAEDLMREGMSPEQARREARHRFGIPEQVHENARRARGVASLDEHVRNVRFAFRSMRRNPVLTGTFVLTLALCIGLGTAVYTAVGHVLWRPLPYPDADRLAMVAPYLPSQGEPTGRAGVDGDTWMRLTENAGEIQTAVYTGWSKGVNMSTDGTARFANQQRVGAGFFHVLGMPPILGRGFTPEEDVADGPAVAVLSHGFWQEVFGSDAEVLGRTLRLKGELHTVVGVLSPEFRSDTDADVFTPLRASRTGEGAGTNYAAIARIPDGMTWDAARARLAGIELAPTPSGEEPRLGLVPLNTALTASMRLPLLVLLAAAGLMILVGFLNLAGVQISRALARQGEMATRQALGSGSRVLARQVLTENLVLGVLGGGLGLAVGTGALRALGTVMQSMMGMALPVSLDATGLTTAGLLTLAAVLVFALAPLRLVGGQGALRLLVSGSRGIAGGAGHKARRVLLVGQVGLVTVLLFSALLLARSYGQLVQLDPGFQADGVLTAQVSLDDARYRDASQVMALFEGTTRELEALPNVARAGVALSLPYERPLNLNLDLGPDAQDPGLTNMTYVTPGFLETLAVPLLSGRGIRSTDDAGAPGVVVVNQALVDRYFDGALPVGTPIRLAGFPEPVEVVGVVGNVLQAGGIWGSRDPVWAAPSLYMPAAQMDGGMLSQVHVWFSPSWAMRVRGSEAGATEDLARVFQAWDSELPLARTAWLAQVMDESFAATRFQALFLLVVAGFTFLLAGIGLYGIVSQEVVERRREMGVRMALGASPRQAVVRTGLSGVKLAGWGLVLGTAGSLAAGRALAGLIFGVSPSDPVTLAMLVLAMAAMAVAASFLPASRLGRLSPTAVLRE